MDLECHIPETISKAKSIITDDTCVKFYDETQPLSLETGASGTGLRAALLKP